MVSAEGAHYALAVPTDARARLAAGWLMLGLAALIGSGVFSVLLVAARTPYFQHAFPVADFFRVALVVHVDFSVLVWFLALGGVLWSEVRALADPGAVVQNYMTGLGGGDVRPEHLVAWLDDLRGRETTGAPLMTDVV